MVVDVGVDVGECRGDGDGSEEQNHIILCVFHFPTVYVRVCTCIVQQGSTSVN